MVRSHLEVESVDAVEGVVRVHVERVDREIVSRQFQRRKHLCADDNKPPSVPPHLAGAPMAADRHAFSAVWRLRAPPRGSETGRRGR